VPILIKIEKSHTIVASDCVGGASLALELGSIEEFSPLGALLGNFIYVKVLILALSIETQKTDNH
jgi:hypothetical protein